MHCMPSDSDDEPLTAAIESEKKGEEIFIKKTQKYASNALGSSHRYDMKANQLIAKSRWRQNRIELENLEKKKKKDIADSDSSDDGFLQVLHRPKQKPTLKMSVSANTLKTEKRDSSDEEVSGRRSKKRKKKNSESVIRIEDEATVLPNPGVQVVDLRLKKEFENIEREKRRDRKNSEKSRKKNKGKKSPGVSSPMDVDNTSSRPVKGEPTDQSNTVQQSRSEVIRERELRKKEQLEKNGARLQTLKDEKGQIMKAVAEIDIQMAKLASDREKHMKEIQTKDEHIEKLENFNRLLHQNGYNTPHKKSASKKSSVGDDVRGRVQTISISSDEEKAPIWEKQFYRKKN